MDAFMRVTKALSDRSRVRALMLLRGGELCLCQLIEVLALAPSTVSKHLSVLQDAGLVTARKEGRWHYYRLPGRAAPVVVRHALRWMAQSLADDAEAAGDEARRGEVLCLSKAELCECYRI